MTSSRREYHKEARILALEELVTAFISHSLTTQENFETSLQLVGTKAELGLQVKHNTEPEALTSDALHSLAVLLKSIRDKSK